VRGFVDIRFKVTPAARRLPPAERERILANPGFGKVFSEHMAVASWERDAGWHNAEIRPYGPIPMDPGTSVLHYAQAVFRGTEGIPAAGRASRRLPPRGQRRRFRRSSRRLALPELPDPAFVAAIDQLVGLDADWVPSAPSTASTSGLSCCERGQPVCPSVDAVTFLLIASPSGSYFPTGVKPVSVWLSEDFSRAAPGGTGAAKTGGNYAGSLLAQAQAAEQGCDQVVWLDAIEHRWVEEMGGMNLFFVFAPVEGETHDSRAHRHAPARHHTRCPADAGQGPRLRGGRRTYQRRPVAGRRRGRLADRSLRVRDGGRDHARRRREVGERLVASW